MDVDTEPSHTWSSLPIRPPLSAVAVGRSQFSSPANDSPGLDTVSLPVRGGRSTTITAMAEPPVMGPGSWTLAIRPSPVKPSASPTSISNTAAVQPFRFSSLPEDLKARTLSFVPARQVATVCRAVCKDLRDFVDSKKDHIARLKIMRRHADLQDHIDSIKRMQPSNLVSFISSFRFWTEHRGFVSHNHQVAYRSFLDWINLTTVHGGTVGMSADDWRRRTTRWESLAHRLIKLQVHLARARRRYRRDPSGQRRFQEILRYALERKKTTAIDHSQYAHFCKLVCNQPAHQPLFKCKPLFKRGGKNKRNVPEYETYPTHLLTRVTRGKGYSHHTLDRFCPPRNVAQLKLPSLPDTRFCYYVDEGWGREALNQKLPFSLMEKAAILELVKIF